MTNYRKLKSQIAHENGRRTARERRRAGVGRSRSRDYYERRRQHRGASEFVPTGKIPDGLWTIETTGKPGVVHYAPTGTTNALCQTTPKTHWRTPPKMIRGEKLCRNCERIAAADWRDRADTERPRVQHKRAVKHACPSCLAEPFTPCIDSITGKSRAMHADRWNLGEGS